MVAELARVRFFVAALKSGDSSYPKGVSTPMRSQAEPGNELSLQR